MKAMLVDTFGGADVMRSGSIEAPEPRMGEVVVEIRAAGVNPLDAVVRAGYGKDIIPTSFPFVPGHDFSGVVGEVGTGCSRLKVGDEVFGYTFPNVIKWGTYAERITLPECWVGRKPSRLSFAEAAAFPIPALTSFQLLDGWAKMTSGEVILIHGAAGGVGSMAVQLASHRGLTVMATASERNHEYLKSLGADIVIDYNVKDFAEVAKRHFPSGIDLVMYTLSIVDNDFDYGADTLFRSADVLKGGGRLGSGSRLASIVNMSGHEPELRRRAINYHYISARPNFQQLEDLGELIRVGAIRPPKVTVLPLDQAVKAHEMIETKHVAGKIVLEI